MKKPKLNLIIIPFILFIFFALITTSYAFHLGGVAECEGCHTMHNSYQAKAMTTHWPQYHAGPYLLQGTDQSSTCLNCHMGDQGGNTQSYHVATPDASMPLGTPPNNYTPGGDFAWLKKDYSWTDEFGVSRVSKGERRGHNIIARDYGFVQDSTIATAPGGDTFEYPAENLHCTSCHDPHGKYRLNADNGVFTTTGKPIYSSSSYGALPTTKAAVGAYRLLAGMGYQPKSLSGSYAFDKGAPIVAVTPADYNKPETQGTDQVIVAYGRSVSLWCANCHAQMHNTYGTVIHPADQQIATDVANTYNKYKKTGDMSGTVLSSYLSLVPFQHDNFPSIATMNTYVGKANGPTSSDRVMCLSCHRAHASGFDSMSRFGLSDEFITVDNGSGTPLWPDPIANPAQAMGRTTSETQAAYYGRPATVFAVYQRVLCNKCHAMD